MFSFLTRRKKPLSGAPFRFELPDMQEVAARCKEMATAHNAAPGKNIRDLFRELRKSESVLWKVHETQGKLDNFYIILAQIQKTRTLLGNVTPRLPRIQDGSSPGVVRLYEIAVRVVTYTDSRIEGGHLSAYIEAYQTISGLRNSELMAIQALFKLALIANLRRLAVRLAHRQTGARQTTLEQDAADRTSWRNCISSLRFLDTIDWPQFINKLSIIEPVLCREESAIYPKMDFHSRERYRKEVEKIAKRAGVPEMDVACRAVLLAGEAEDAEGADGGDHVGYYLIGKGRRVLERSLGIRWTVRHLLQQLLGTPALWAYLGGILTITVLLTAGLLTVGYAGYGYGGLQVVVTLLLVLCASELGRLIVEAVVGYACETSPLPKLDLSNGIPREYSTLVVVPSLLTSEGEIEELVHMLEVRFIAGKGENLYFGLLTDFPDARQATLPEDDRLLQLALEKITALNDRYRHTGNGLFYLFHRPRKWNPVEQIWMGYERKRGKLMALNGLLRENGEENFSCIIGDRTKLTGIKYVITLDSDTQLPRDAAWKMIASMAHPLNRARYNEEKRRVTAGYGILQPRIRTDLRGATASLYESIYGHGPNMDPYTYASPDVYQDLFGEGSYIGKGIYDVDVVLKTLHGRLPENRILSHDLLEGCYARSGLLNDLKLFERSFNYWVDVKRRHRWIRGDWQIAAWIGPLAPGAQKKWVRNRLSALSRWKILDNLRVSLLPAGLLSLLLLGWTVLPHIGMSTLFVLTMCLFPALTIVVGKLFENPAKIVLLQQWRYACSEASSRFKQCLYSIVCLPYDSFIALHAIALVCWRMLFSHKKLLEWTPSGSRESGRPYRLAEVYRKMWVAPLIGVLTAIAALVFRPAALGWESPVLLCWITAPIVVWWANRPLDERRRRLTPAQQRTLRQYARRTWAYFEQHIGKNGNWLPPDHHQEYPEIKTAEYTSPTNLGLALLSGLTAADLGYVTRRRFLERTSRTLQAMSYLERYRGHFYNWYDTRLLQPTIPRYVSTVDSGNLAGHIHILRRALLTMPGQAVIGGELFMGMLDTVEVLEGVMGPSPASVGGLTSALSWCKASLQETLGSPMDTLEKAGAAIDRLRRCLDELETAEGEAGYWTEALRTQARDVAEELAVIAPWLTLSAAPAQYEYLLPKHIPSLKEIAEMEVPSEEDAAGTDERKWLSAFRECIGKASRVARERLDAITVLVRQCHDFADIDYTFLYNRSEQLLSIGYQVEDGRPDTDYYDVLASEARLATYIGVCQDKLPVKSWFALGRTQVDIAGSLVLLSSGGTLFEYLMPQLVMPVFESTLLDRACKSSVRQQIAHGAEDGIPWGISESCYGMMDAHGNYQYKVFGTPALSLKHGYSEEEKVVAPYAAMMALMVAPGEAFDNLQRLAELGMVGRYGFFEAIDYTPSRAASEGCPVIVRSFMAHHQGMSLLALGYLLLDRPLQQLFFADPELASSLELLQEKVPEDVILHPHLGRKARPAEGGGNTFSDAWKGIAFYRQLAESVLRTGCPADPVASQYRGLTFFKPAVLVRVSHAAHTELVAHMIQLHGYWRAKGLPVTLVIWNEDTGCYRDFLQRLIIELITGGIGAEALNRHGGGIFIKIIDTLSEEDHAFLATVTRVVTPEHHQENTRSIVKL